MQKPPYSTTVNAWSYGFVFRSNDDDGVSSYRVTAKSNQKAGFVRWWNVNKSESFTEVRASVISTTESGWNSLELRVEADIASLSINGTNIGHFPQSTTDDPGKVCAGTGFLGSDMTLGKVTPVKNWRIESLDN